ncbi:MAG: hypothetical protein JW852_11045 [Spirochaetales bacterium]|nr:hypothetical protein [Spirochaetales bacterium]
MIETIPAKNLEYYGFSPDSDLAERNNVSSEIVMQYLHEYDDPDGTYALYEPTDAERAILARYCAMCDLTQNLGLAYTIRISKGEETIMKYRPFNNPAILKGSEHLEFLKIAAGPLNEY